MVSWRTQDQSPRRRYILPIAVGLVIMGGLAYGGYLWHYSGTHVSTDDACVAAHMAPINARIPGTVIEVVVDDNQDVKAGEVLVRLDPKDYEVALAQARAAADATKGDLENARVNVPLTDETTHSLVQQAEAALEATQDATQVAVHDLEERQGQLKAKRAAEGRRRAAGRGGPLTSGGSRQGAKAAKALPLPTYRSGPPDQNILERLSRSALEGPEV